MIELEQIHLKQGTFELSVPAISIQTGEMIAVMGNNGSGKSTFLSMLAGLTPYSGSYRLKQRELQYIPFLERYQLISLLSQQASLNMPFPVEYVVLTGRFPHVTGSSYGHADQQATHEVLKNFDLLSLKDRLFNQLSGGEKQRVLLARMINREADLLLLDEPLSSVDIKHQFKILGDLRQRKQNRTIIVVIHDLPMAYQEFDRFIFFENGYLVYDEKRRNLDAGRLSKIFDVCVTFSGHAEKRFVQVESHHNHLL